MVRGRRAARVPPLLVFGYGNPGRGDDALGPLFLEHAAGRFAAHVGAGELELLGDFQLQIEHALDLAGRDGVLFVDASQSGAEPFDLAPVQAAPDTSFSTHSLTPAALLHVFERTAERTPPHALVLAIRGYGFELGEPIGARAAANLESALAWAGRWLANPRAP